jgi:hypothetical protein
MKTGLSGPTRRKLRGIPAEELEEILAWVRGGERAFEIMERWGIRLETVYRLEYPEKGLPGRLPRIPDERRATIMADYVGGVAIREIERKHGVHRCTVWAIRRETGTPLRYPKMGWRRRARPKAVDLGYYVEGPSPL